MNFSLQAVIGYIRKLTTPDHHIPENGIRYWQDKILLIILLVSLTFGFVVYIPSLWLSIRTQVWSVAIIDTVVYGWVVFLNLKRTLPYNVRAFSVVALFYILGLTLIITLGPFGAGPVWLFFFPIISALLLGERFSITALSINILTLILFGFLISLGLFSWSSNIDWPVILWIILALNFELLDITATVSIATILKGLQKSLELERAVSFSLESKRVELLESNQKLKTEIVEREQVEQSLLESEEKYRTLVSRMNEGVLMLNQDSLIIFGNSKLFEITGYSEEELLSCNYTRLFNGENLSKMKRLIDESGNRFSESTEVILARKDGSRIPLLVSGSPVFRSSGEWEIIFVLTDITSMKLVEHQLKDYQEQLEEKIKVRTKDLELAKQLAESANQAKTEFLANISHELRTPMHHILNYSQFGLTKFDRSDKPKLLHYFSQIRKTGERLMYLLNDLLDLSKLESGKMDLELSRSDVSQTLGEVLRIFKSSLMEKSLLLEIIHDDQVETVLECDQYKLAQVFQNLISNAIKYSHPNKSIIIKFSKDHLNFRSSPAAALKVSIQDEGVGIPENEIGAVFEKFVQSSTTKSGAGGTGLGLAICKQIINLHQGEIFAESNPEGGTIVSFKIPFQRS